ncbi:MAG: HAMP domain-containing protein, partial [Proteobacteria bacterium]|nr:HAMP domain-containing protein [Pseudomonadota bacterium]
MSETAVSRGWRSTKSVRVRTLLVVLLVVFALPVSVWLSRLTNPGWAAKLRWDIAAATTAVATVIGDSEKVDAIAEKERAWVRVIKKDGTPIHNSDHTQGGQASKLFWGPEGPPTLGAHDEKLPPLVERETVIAALNGQAHAACDLAGEMLLCTEVRREGDYVIHVQKGSFGAIRSLYDVRFEIGALTLNLLVVGVLAGLWLGWRLVKPMENLRRQVLDRTTGPLSTKPLEVSRKDEFGDLGRAFNELLAALEARNKANEIFAADLAHELKNPTAAIKAATEALERGPAEDQRIKRLIRIFRTSSERLESVVSQYLELARAEAGLALEERTEVRLDELVRGVTSIVEQDERFAQVRFAVEAPEVTLP